ncbi:hypothetical protein TrVE_jg2480 [Triparma verrucosa]|uniref:Uncharacterized protein n=1 Tax=Triparma verrucosa TaxID=1606542 RepID=A0A9W7BZ67_9STRA|nr:hypothetical protein TrVE_jg2480 [Triparma verrucosa]
MTTDKLHSVERAAFFTFEKGTIFCNLESGGGTTGVRSDEGLGEKGEVITLKPKQKGVLWGEYERNQRGKVLCRATCDTKEIRWDKEATVFVSFRIYLFRDEDEEEDGGSGHGGEEGGSAAKREEDVEAGELRRAVVPATITLSCNGKSEIVDLAEMPRGVWICISMKEKVDLAYLEGLAIRGEIVEVIGAEAVLFDTMIVSPSRVPLQLMRNPSILQEDLTILLELKSKVRQDIDRVRTSLREFQNRPPFFSDHCYAWSLWTLEIFYCLYRSTVFTLIFSLLIVPMYTIKWLVILPAKKVYGVGEIVWVIIKDYVCERNFNIDDNDDDIGEEQQPTNLL